MATQEPTDPEQSNESEQTDIQNIIPLPEEFLLMKYMDLFKRSSINNFYTPENSKSCENRITRRECEIPDISFESPFMFGTDPLHKRDNNDLLGWNKTEANQNTQEFFKKFSEKHGLEMNQQKLKEFITFGKRIEMTWGETEKYIEEYTNNLLFDLKQNRDLLNENRDEYDKIPEILDSVSAYKAQGKISDLRRLIKTFSYSHGPKHNTLYDCVWEENEETPGGNCIDYSLYEDEYEDEDDYDETETIEEECDEKTFDKKLFEVGGTKITIGIVLVCIAIKLYMDLDKLKKAAAGATAQIL